MAASSRTVERKLPPIIPMAVVAMILVIIGGIYVAAYLPQRPSFTLPIVLIVAAGVLVVINVVALTRLKDFAWGTFFTVGRWALLAYLIIAGMLEFVFALDGTPGDVLALLTVMLAIYAVDIPLILAFSVARYQPADGRSGE